MSYGAETLLPETEVTLLLCGRFGGKVEQDGSSYGAVPDSVEAPDTQDGEPRAEISSPLEAREYNRLLAWLDGNSLSLRALSNLEDVPGGGDTPDDEPSREDLPIDRSRLATLLARGTALALAVEAWTGKGLWVLSRFDEAYPERLTSLGTAAPPLLYGAGHRDLLSAGDPALAVVGSRRVDDEVLELTRSLGRLCARQGVIVVSGAARGIDSESMVAALESGGTSIGVVADSLGRAVTSSQVRESLLEGNLVLISPYDPGASFNVGSAMGRNKYIYALADAALVVQTSLESGGTWAGATEALKRHRPPVFVSLREPVPDGNRALLSLGAQPFPDIDDVDLPGWLSSLESPLEVEGISGATSGPDADRVRVQETFIPSPVQPELL